MSYTQKSQQDSARNNPKNDFKTKAALLLQLATLFTLKMSINSYQPKALIDECINHGFFHGLSASGLNIMLSAFFTHWHL